MAIELHLFRTNTVIYVLSNKIFDLWFPNTFENEFMSVGGLGTAQSQGSAGIVFILLSAFDFIPGCDGGQFHLYVILWVRMLGSVANIYITGSLQ